MERAGLMCEMKKLGAMSTKTEIRSVHTFSNSMMGMFNSIGAVST